MSISELRKSGYAVEESHPATDEQSAIFHVSGFGVELSAFENDSDVFAAILASHDFRVKQLEEGIEE